jgi:hypothetical protein
MLTMKKVLIAIIGIVLLPTHFQAKAQTYVWKTPQPVTDSLSNNQNPIISSLDYYDGLGYYVFYERSVDSLSTAIYVKNFYTTDDPQPLIYNGDHHFRNPQIIRGSMGYYPDSIFYLAYESDSCGNKDIYAVRISTSTISNPILVSNNTMDDSHLKCNFVGSMVWENNGQILYARLEDKNTPNWYISNPIVISDSNSYNPVINCKNSWHGTEYIAWEKHADTNASVYYSYRVNPDSAWSTPISLYDTGYNKNLLFSNDFWGMGVPIMTWDNEVNGFIRPMAYDFYDGDYYKPELLQGIPFTPTILPMMIPVDFWSDCFFAVSKQENSSTDIYVNSFPWLGQYYNLTETWQVDQNPQIFEGKDQLSGQDFILIWESERNNNWQLWSSVYTMPMGWLDESNSNTLQLIAIPNPFSTYTTFEYTLEKPSDITITIYNSQGQVVERMHERQDKGVQRVEWSAEGLPKGLYYFVLRTVNEVSVAKMIKQ